MVRKRAAGGIESMRGVATSASTWRTLGLIIPVVLLLSLPTLADPLRISGMNYLGDLPTLVAERNGFFARHHGDVEAIQGESGRDNLRRLRAREIDFALMHMTPLVFDALANPTRGGPDDPVILANLSHARPVIHLMLLDAGGAAPGEALRGRRVGVPRGSNAEYVLHVIASIAGISNDEYTVVDMEAAEMGDALASGRIDAASVWDPWTRRLRDRFGDRLTEEPDLGSYVSRWVLVARRGSVDSDPEHAIAVLRAYRDAVDWIQANEEAALAISEAHGSGAAGPPIGLAPDLLFDVTLDWSLIASYRQQIAWARARSDMDDNEVPSFMDIVAPAPLAAIAPEAVLMPHNPSDGDGYGE